MGRWFQQLQLAPAVIALAIAKIAKSEFKDRLFLHFAQPTHAKQIKEPVVSERPNQLEVKILNRLQLGYKFPCNSCGFYFTELLLRRKVLELCDVGDVRSR